MKDEGSATHCGETGFRPQLFHAAAVQEKDPPLMEEQSPPQQKELQGKIPH